MSANHLSESDLLWLSNFSATLMSEDDDPVLLASSIHENYDISDWQKLFLEPSNSVLLEERLDDVPNIDEKLRVITEELRQSIKKEIRVVKQKTQESSQVLSPTPISWHIPLEYIFNVPLNCEFINPRQEGNEEKKSRAKAILVGTNITSFKLSENAITFVKDYEKEKMRQYCISERLEGWRIDQKRRGDGRTFDMYFEHEASKGKFRSVIEVVNFIMHEAYPKKAPNSARPQKSDDNVPHPQVPPGFEEPGKYNFPQHLFT